MNSVRVMSINPSFENLCNNLHTISLVVPILAAISSRVKFRSIGVPTSSFEILTNNFANLAPTG